MNSNGSSPAPIKEWADLPEWIDVRQASELSGYSLTYLRRIMRDGRIEAKKRGTMWWIDRESLRAYLAIVEALGSKKHSPHGIGKTPEGN